MVRTWRSSLLCTLLSLSFLLQVSCPGRLFEDLSARALKKKMDEGVAMTIIDLRSPREYAEGHVPGAINVPPDRLYLLKEVLPEDRSRLLVFYCRGSG